jgi:tRNA-2-methylthio-N6-dimethylallyladenosine synthase
MVTCGTYQVRTVGCQTNVHDSERLSGLIADTGYGPAPAGADHRRRGPGTQGQ